MIERNLMLKLHTLLVCGQSFFKARLARPSINVKRGQLAEHCSLHGSRCSDGTTRCSDGTNGSVASDNDETRSVMRHARQFILAYHARFRAVLDYFPVTSCRYRQFLINMGPFNTGCCFAGSCAVGVNPVPDLALATKHRLAALTILTHAAGKIPYLAFNCIYDQRPSHLLNAPQRPRKLISRDRCGWNEHQTRARRCLGSRARQGCTIDS